MQIANADVVPSSKFLGKQAFAAERTTISGFTCCSRHGCRCTDSKVNLQFRTNESLRSTTGNSRAFAVAAPNCLPIDPEIWSWQRVTSGPIGIIVRFTAKCCLIAARSHQVLVDGNPHRKYTFLLRDENAMVDSIAQFRSCLHSEIRHREHSKLHEPALTHAGLKESE